MYHVTLRFYEELNDFLPAAKRKVDFTINFPERRSVKDLVESLGVPHTEIDVILANGESVNFSYIVKDEDRFSIYPVFESLDVTHLSRLRDVPLRDTCFVLDVHLGKLARYLRMLGFDCDYSDSRNDDELARISIDEKKILLTRDRGILKRANIDRALCIHSTVSEEQAAEVIRRLDLASSIRPFSRCTECNALVRKLDDGQIPADTPDGVKQWCTEYFRCPGCGRLYWKGSHADRMVERITRIIHMAEETGFGENKSGV